MFELKMVSAQTLQYTTVAYTIWNILRYITLGVLVLKANHRNINDIEQYKKYCCDCYYISRDPTQYGLSLNDRFDLSYCIPDCTDCAFCESRFNHSANASFRHEATCPVSHYQDTYKSFSLNWHKATDCPHNIALTSMHFFTKSYFAYGTYAVVSTVLYALLMILMMVYALRAASMSNSMLVYMFIYNFLVSEIVLYLMYKPFQFYHKTIPLNDGQDAATCEIDSLSSVVIKDMLTVSIWLSLFFAACHFVSVMYKLISYCCLCIKQKRYENRGRQQSIAIEYNDRIVNGVENRYYKMTSVEAKSYACRWFVIGAAVLCLMIFFLCLSIYATVLMIQAGLKAEEEYDEWKISVISIVMTLLLLSFIDSPLVWLKLYEKCTQRKQNNAFAEQLL